MTAAAAVVPASGHVATPPTHASAAPTAPASPPAAPVHEVAAAAEKAARASTELAVAVLDLRTGDLAIGRRGGEPFLTTSLSKIVLAVDILNRRRVAGLAVEEEDLRLIHAALGPSDDNAMNTLWVRFDGPGAAQRVADRVGLTRTSPHRDPSQWGEMTTTAAEHAHTDRHSTVHSPVASRRVLDHRTSLNSARTSRVKRAGRWPGGT